MTPSQLYSRILPYVQGCPEPIVDQAVMDAVTEFAERSQASFTLESPIPLVDGKSTYYVFPDFGLSTDLIRHVYCGLTELRQCTPSTLRDEVPNWEVATAAVPTHYTCYGDAGEITVYGRPLNSNGASLRVIASWSPTLTAKAFPSALGERYGRDIAEGAKASLMMIADRKWTNLKMAGIAREKFENAIVDARLLAIHANAAGTITARPQRFGG